MSLYFFFFREFHILYLQQEMLGFISMEHILNLAQYRRQGHFFWDVSFWKDLVHKNYFQKGAIGTISSIFVFSATFVP